MTVRLKSGRFGYDDVASRCHSGANAVSDEGSLMRRWSTPHAVLDQPQPIAAVGTGASPRWDPIAPLPAETGVRLVGPDTDLTPALPRFVLG